ncbi:UDP-glucose/GDP-mannose dehydrogenase family protein [Halorarum halobium]|uniref:UDP-glucose/GDP-mannose dehydrogenase family protein n=1 Tax=Halorarum halobium TaxID=3075121 RepID=UPI0028A80808|nr:UDP-glucose/GDP-mannose dehydrogenase family protein [Halobaculum sp. XH14]
MNVSVVGSGYVGTTLAACLAAVGHDVVNVDIDEDVVAAINAGESPIHEEGLPELVAEHAGDNLRATTSYDAVPETDVTFITVQTPSREDGSLDYSYVEAAAEMTGEALGGKTDAHVVAVKSTVLPGTIEDVVVPAVRGAAERTGTEEIGFVANPEFLSEGTAVSDFWNADKIVVGTSEPSAAATVRDLYHADERLADVPVVETDVRTGEMIKYANNAFLAAKVSLVNELGNVCKRADIDSYEVADALGLDDRICAAFMRSGLGWGGSCFPKDVDALRAFARQQEYPPELLDAAVDVNDRQPERMVGLLREHVDPDGARVAVLGLAFKPGTDDVRNSRALDVIEQLDDAGADVVAYDPVAAENARTALEVDIEYADSVSGALSGADAALLTTEWPEFDGLSFDGMDRSVVIDGRRVDVDTGALDVYEGLCW